MPMGLGFKSASGQIQCPPYHCSHAPCGTAPASRSSENHNPGKSSWVSPNLVRPEPVEG